MDALRQQLSELLDMKGAHIGLDSAVADFPPEMRGRKANGAPHTAWQLLEHMRIAQWDILEFSRDAKHESPEWPGAYWPAMDAPPDHAAWDKSMRQFKHDLREMKDLIADVGRDLFARIPHGEGQTLLREALVLADHNSYHLGQLVFLKKMLRS